MNIALDTNAYSDYARGDPRRVRVLQAAARIHMPLFTLAELKAGFLRGTRVRQNEALLLRFFRSPRVNLLLPDEQTANHFAFLDQQLRRQGTPIPVNDLWIAALVIQHGLILCTSDAHFSHLPQIPTC